MSHIPFRSWCAHCAKGKAVNQGHSRRTEVSEVPNVSIDYAYANEYGEERKKQKWRERKGEEAGEGESRGMPMLVVIYDSNSTDIASEVLPGKGVNEYAARRLAQIVNRLGYRRVLIEPDQEPSIMALKAVVERELLLEVSFEESQVGEHQSNGAIENAVRRVQGQVRTIRDA